MGMKADGGKIVSGFALPRNSILRNDKDSLTMKDRRMLSSKK